MARVIISMGGNIGDVKSCLRTAQQLVNDRVGVVMRCSHRYKSKPWGFSSDNEFSNQVLEADTELSPEQVLDALQAIETELGRDRETEEREKQQSGEPYASRRIDMDILLYDDVVVDSERLKIPHPHIAEREFVLIPMCEFMRGRHHPATGKTIGEMLDDLRATTETVLGQ